jgi:hypothetical protein
MNEADAHVDKMYSKSPNKRVRHEQCPIFGASELHLRILQAYLRKN